MKFTEEKLEQAFIQLIGEWAVEVFKVS